MTLGPAYGGGGTGAGFQLFTKADNSQGVFADAAARDAYFGANQAEVDRAAANEFLIIRLNDNGSGAVAYQQYNGAEGAPNVPASWLDVTSLVQGTPGSGSDFSSIPARHVPAIGADNLPFDSGLVVASDGTIQTPGSIRAAIASFFLEDQFRISGAGETLSFEDMFRGVQRFPITQVMDLTDDERPLSIRQGAALNIAPQTDDTQTVINPDFEFTPTGGDEVVYSITVRTDAPQTGVVADFHLQGQASPFFFENIGSLPTGDTVILLDPPVKLIGGQTYRLHIYNKSGTPVELKGNTSGAIWYEAQIRPFTHERIAYSSEHFPVLTQIGYTLTDNGATVPPNTAIHAATNAGDITLNFANGTSPNDRMQLRQHITGGTLTLHSDAGFAIIPAAGGFLTDTDITITDSPLLTFYWGGADWRLFGV